MSLALLLALAAPQAPGRAMLVSCRMDECAWSREISNRVVRVTPRGTLRKFVELQGTSVERADDERASAKIKWRSRPSVDYVFCSKAQPAFAFRDGRRWTAHALDLFNLYGYDTPSAATYLWACHRIDAGKVKDVRRIERRLGYRPGTRSEQVEIASPAQLVSLPARRKD